MKCYLPILRLRGYFLIFTSESSLTGHIRNFCNDNYTLSAFYTYVFIPLFCRTLTISKTLIHRPMSFNFVFMSNDHPERSSTYFTSRIGPIFFHFFSYTSNTLNLRSKNSHKSIVAIFIWHKTEILKSS